MFLLLPNADCPLMGGNLTPVSASVFTRPSQPSVCVSLCLAPLRTFVVACKPHQDNPENFRHLETLSLSTSAKTLFPNKHVHRCQGLGPGILESYYSAYHTSLAGTTRAPFWFWLCFQSEMAKYILPEKLSSQMKGVQPKITLSEWSTKTSEFTVRNHKTQRESLMSKSQQKQQATKSDPQRLRTLLCTEYTACLTGLNAHKGH